MPAYGAGGGGSSPPGSTHGLTGDHEGCRSDRVDGRRRSLCAGQCSQQRGLAVPSGGEPGQQDQHRVEGGVGEFWRGEPDADGEVVHVHGEFHRPRGEEVVEGQRPMA
jgi:hypothetical protein